MSANQAVFPVAAMVRVLGVSGSGYHAWRQRAPSVRVVNDELLMKKVRTIHLASQAEARMVCFAFIEGFYNPVRLHAALGYLSPTAYGSANQMIDPGP